MESRAKPKLGGERSRWRSASAAIYASLQIEEPLVEEESLSPPRPPRVLSVLSHLLGSAIRRNEKASPPTPTATPGPSVLTVFHGQRAPDISLYHYILRVFKYANCSPSCFVIAYVYIDRIMRAMPSAPVTSLNVHRLLITSITLAAKFFDDVYYNNAYYAKVGGVSALEMNRLELEFLFNLDFRLHVTVETFEKYCCHLEREMSLSGCHRIEKPLPPQPSHVCSFQEGSDTEIRRKPKTFSTVL